MNSNIFFILKGLANVLIFEKVHDLIQPKPIRKKMSKTECITHVLMMLLMGSFTPIFKDNGKQLMGKWKKIIRFLADVSRG